MNNWFGVWLNGQGLQDISPSILIHDIREDAPDYQVYTSGNAGMTGSHVLGRGRKSLSVTITYSVRERNLQARMEIFQSIASWVNAEGKLAVNYRPNQFCKSCRTRVQAFPAHSTGVTSRKSSSRHTTSRSGRVMMK